MSFEPREFLRHILAEADYLVAASTGVTRQQFDKDPTLQRAFVRSLEIVGEAAKKVPHDMRSEHPEVERRAMAGMRDRLIHGYFGVDLDLAYTEHLGDSLTDWLHEQGPQPVTGTIRNPKAA